MSAGRRLSDTMYYVTSLANAYSSAGFRQVQLLTSVTTLPDAVCYRDPQMQCTAHQSISHDSHKPCSLLRMHACMLCSANTAQSLPLLCLQDKLCCCRVGNGTGELLQYYEWYNHNVDYARAVSVTMSRVL
jgi:hypothetical protein